MNRLLDWLDERTGLRAGMQRCLDRKIPGGACGLSVWPAAILFSFLVQAVTGLCLWIYYSPSANSAWESVYFLQHQVAGGWLLRGLHHFSAQVLVGMIAVYVIQMIFRGAYRAPREFVFWTAVLLGLTAMAAVITGDLLAWDQNSYWATQVRVNFLTLLPLVGDDLYKLAAGGPAFGHLTLTRFFALHAGVFSAAFFLLLMVHGHTIRRADASQVASGGRAGWYWPNQAVWDASACLAVTVVVLALSVQQGAALGAPADPADAYAAARPEWSLLGVYELSNMFPGDPMPGVPISWKIVPIFVVPGVVVLLVLAMPLAGCCRRGHVMNVLLTGGILIGVLVLSLRVVVHDRSNENHQAALAAGREQAHRAVELARSPQGIGVGGALALLRNDPKTQGPILFKRHCASCHDHLGEGEAAGIEAETPSAPNLYQFSSHDWLAGFLDRDRIATEEYFGNTVFADGEMVDFVSSSLRELKDDVGEEEYQAIIAALAKESSFDEPRAAESVDEATKFLFEDFTCIDCHRFYDLGDLGGAPDLTGYGSREWLIGIISDPGHERFYRSDNDRMPAYAESASEPEANILTAGEVGMLADWLRGVWYKP